MTIEGTTSTATPTYARTGWWLKRNVVSGEDASRLVRRLLGTDPATTPQVPLERELYGDPEFDALLPALGEMVSDIAEIEAIPTYSFARLYPRGRTLPLHRDRPACEHSISIHLGSSSPGEWPFWMRDVERGRHHVDLGAGDGVFYRGMEVQHWRGACPVDWYAQAFFHFVDGGGPHSNERFDRRPALGLPETTKVESS